MRRSRARPDHYLMVSRAVLAGFPPYAEDDRNIPAPRQRRRQLRVHLKFRPGLAALAGRLTVLGGHGQA
jgi:hypothetical protein